MRHSVCGAALLMCCHGQWSTAVLPGRWSKHKDLESQLLSQHQQGVFMMLLRRNHLIHASVADDHGVADDTPCAAFEPGDWLSSWRWSCWQEPAAIQWLCLAAQFTDFRC